MGTTSGKRKRPRTLRLPLLLPLLLLAAAGPRRGSCHAATETADAAVGDAHLLCRDVNLGGGAFPEQQRVCATYRRYAPSPETLPDGSTINVGPFGYNFVYWDGSLPNGTDTAALDDAIAYQTGATASVSWKGFACGVVVSGEACASCRVCEDKTTAVGGGDMAHTTLSADCTNLYGGRVVDCAPALIFYPLQVALDNGSAALPAAAKFIAASSNAARTPRGVLQAGAATATAGVALVLLAAWR